MGEINGNFKGVHEWELGLPNADDITPLTQGLIPAELLSAFNIKPEPYRTAGDVVQASEHTISSLRGTNFPSAAADDDDGDGDVDEISESKNSHRNVSPEDADSAAEEKSVSASAAGAGGGKRSRLVWTPQLHKRFVDVVSHLGIKSAVPKTIMQLMNVEGLTRENVASHLQKYRLYLKRMHGGGGSFDCDSSAGGVGENSNSPPAQDNGHVPAQPAQQQMMVGSYETQRSHHVYQHQQGQQQQYHTNNYNYYQNSYQNNYNCDNNSSNQFSNNGSGNSGMMHSGMNKYGAIMPYHHHQQHANNHPHVSPGDN